MSPPANHQGLRSAFGGFYAGKRVFISGHTGFKGSWLCLWLHSLGADVYGYALNPPTDPNLFDLCKINGLVKSTIADVRDRESLIRAMHAARPDVAIHMAAQPLVRDSYQYPVDTYAINVMGTVNFFEAVREAGTVKSVVNVTTDKCYENREWLWGYRENEPLGGYDPYSNSKACSELVTSAYRSSYFNPADYSVHGVGVATARAGNVIGGGDWATDRLVPDCVRSILKKEKVIIRNPHAIRPWQHVVEPLSGYLMLAQKLYEDGKRFGGAWNFGPYDNDAKPVEWLVKSLCSQWGPDASFGIDSSKNHPHEAHHLKLDCSKATSELGWRPRWSLDKAIAAVVAWTRTYVQGGDMQEQCLQQIGEYLSSAEEVQCD